MTTQMYNYMPTSLQHQANRLLQQFFLVSWSRSLLVAVLLNTGPLIWEPYVYENSEF